MPDFDSGAERFVGSSPTGTSKTIRKITQIGQRGQFAKLLGLKYGVWVRAPHLPQMYLLKKGVLYETV